MSADDRRAVLEAIAYGPDRAIRPGERLRAIELLGESANEREPFDVALFREVQALDGPRLQEQLDAVVAATLIAVDDEQRGRDWPQTCAAVEWMVDERARQVARGLAGEMYRTRAFTVVEGGEPSG